MGLLEKSLMLSQKKAFSFFDFTQKYQLNTCAVFKLKDSNFIIKNCIGFDGKSIISSVSTKDFWDGLIKEKNKLYFFNEQNLLRPFMQLFSDSLKDKIKTLYVYYTDNSILLFLSDDPDSAKFNDSFINDYKEIVDYSEKIPVIMNFTKDNDDFIRLFRLSCEKSVDSFIQKNYNENQFTQDLKQAIYNCISYKLFLNFSTPDYIFKYNKCSFNLVTVSKTEVPYQLLKKHIETSLNEIISFYSEAVELSDYGQAESYHELIEFIQAR